MIEVSFHDSVDDALLKYAVIAAIYKGKWVFCRHRGRGTWEIPGGHREYGEDILYTAKRELYEETGAVDFDIKQVSAYSVMHDGNESYGMLFSAEIKALGKLPEEFEMEEIIFADIMPADLTYPEIQPALFEKVKKVIKTDIIYVENEPVSAREIAQLRKSVGWNGMEDVYKNPLYISYYHIAVYDENALVGYVDTVSNGVSDAYIQDLTVRPDHQGMGIGTELMNRIIAYLKSKKIFMISVIYEEKLRPFYRRFGFFDMLSGQLQTYESE